MDKISLAYGKSTIQFEVPDKFEFEIIKPIRKQSISETGSFDNIINDALSNPIENFALKEVRPKDKIAIAINDKTRPVPLNKILPHLLGYLSSLGAKNDQITIIVAVGTHTPMPDDEFNYLVNEDIINNYHIITHNCDDNNNLIFKGYTSRNTPVFINKTFINSDIKIVVGHIEPHHFMGYSGGIKSAAIGLSGRSTINKNHEMLLDTNCSVGQYYNNPMRMDIEEIGDLIGVDCALNVILDENKNIIFALFGKPRDVMRKGIQLSDSTCRVKVQKKCDLVITSPGGYPKDINLYQSQKAISHASIMTRDNGYILLVAECIEGSGSSLFEKFVMDISCYEDAINKFMSMGFMIGPHKAFQIAREAARVNLLIKSSINDHLSRRFLLTPVSDIESTLKEITNKDSSVKNIGIMPNAINTIPQIN